MRVFIIIGTRPEAIKMLPLVREMRKSGQFETKICFSGQHGEMAKSVFDEFKIAPDFEFSVMKKGQSLNELTNRILNYFDMILKVEKPDLVVVHGDTTTAFCASLSAFYLGIKVAHIEAGLRTFDAKNPFPEEFNRVSIDCVSDLHFAPTKSAAQNLIKEGRKSVFTVGNTVIDAVKYSLSNDVCSPILNELSGRKLVLVTTHRRENLGEKMRSSLLGIRDAIESRDDVLIVVPAHPNPEVRGVVCEVFENIKNIKIIEPLPMREFHHLLSNSFAVFSDSGGIQEEAAYLGVPLFLMREKTEREECLALANTCVVGCSRVDVARAFSEFLNDTSIQSAMRVPSSVFGDGNSSSKIVQILSRMVELLVPTP